MSLRAKFLNVMRTCAYVQRQGENTYHRYRYATAADVFDKVNSALVQEGLISLAQPNIVSTEQVTTAKGGIETRVTVSMTITILDALTGESLVLTGYGSGQDIGDKAVMKAQTAALKYTWMLSLNISTGDDPEADITVDARAALGKAQAIAAAPSVGRRGPMSEQGAVTGQGPSGQAEEGQAAPVTANVEAPRTSHAVASAKDVVSQSTASSDRSARSAARRTAASSSPGKAPLERLKVLYAVARKAGFADEAVKEWLYSTYQVTTSRDLTPQQAAEAISYFKTVQTKAQEGQLAPAVG